MPSGHNDALDANPIRLMLEGSAAAVRASLALEGVVREAADRIGNSLDAGGKLLVCGNGGSAADAQHFVGELLGSLLDRGRAPKPAIALTANSSVTTAIANDYGYEDVFARQVQGLAVAGDVLFGITTSGGSKNIVRAFEAAPAGVRTIALIGPGGVLAEIAELAIRVPVSEALPPAYHTPSIQAAHISIIHAICAHLDGRWATDHGPAR